MDHIRTPFVAVGWNLLCCVYPYSHPGNENDQEFLQTNISQAVSRYEEGETACVDLAKVTTFAWDKLYIFRPYRSSEEIDRILGTFWLDSRFLTISSNEAVTLLVFMRNGSVVQYVELSRGVADFAFADNSQGYDSQKSCFVKNERGQAVFLE
jgi:hypothetical protein